MTTQKYNGARKIAIITVFICVISFSAPHTVNASNSNNNELENIVEDLLYGEDAQKRETLDAQADNVLSDKTNEEINELEHTLREKKEKTGLSESEAALLRGADRRIGDNTLSTYNRIIIIVLFTLLFYMILNN